MSRGKLPMVTDHAVLRYLERVRGVDVDAARREMSVGVVAKAAEVFKNCVVKRGDGACFVIRDGRVVTVRN